MVPRLKADLSAVVDATQKVSVWRSAIDESKFMKWFQVSHLAGNLRRPPVIGEVSEQKAKPSILMACRLKNYVCKDNKEDAKGVPIDSSLPTRRSQVLSHLYGEALPKIEEEEEVSSTGPGKGAEALRELLAKFGLK